jgi:hypothetical protein
VPNALNQTEDGKLGLPSVGPGMNRLGPNATGGGPKERAPKKKKEKPNMMPPVGSSKDVPPVSASADPKDNRSPDDVRKAQVLERARKRMDRAIEVEADNRKQAVECLKFFNSDQWPADVVAQRNFDKRPCLTINKLPTFVRQVTNEQRQNRPAINVSPVGDRGDVEGAKLYRGMIRAIERRSQADVAYDNAFEQAVIAGWGYWRVVKRYVSDNSFDQELAIELVDNQFTVYTDPNSKMPTTVDKEWCFVTDMMPREEFKEKHPRADQMPFQPAGLGEAFKNWLDKDNIRVAEYYEFVDEARTLLRLSTGATLWEDEVSDEVWDAIDAGRVEIDRERRSKKRVLKVYKLTAVDILEESEWEGSIIPVIRDVGNVVNVEGKKKVFGLVRDAKDPQRMFNYWRTAATEFLALAPKAPFVVEEGQIEGYEDQWKQANVKSYPYLMYRGVNVNGTPAPPPQRQPMPQAPTGLMAAAQDAAQDFMAVSGIRFDATMQERISDESGRALREIRHVTNLSTFHYLDNHCLALKDTGDILIEMIPKVYDTRRAMTILREDDSEEEVMIEPGAIRPMTEARHPVSGKVRRLFNPAIGKYGVTVTIGPSYATKRIEAAQSMMDFARAMPATAGLIADLVAKNQDWPGGEEMAARLAKVVAMQHPGILQPDMRDVPPQVQAMLTQLDTNVKQLTAERQQLMQALTNQQADRAQRQDKIDKDFEAKLMGIVQKAESTYQTHVGAELRGLAENVRTLMDLLGRQGAKDALGQAATLPGGQS